MALVVKKSAIDSWPVLLSNMLKQIVKIMDCPASNDYIFKIIPEKIKTFHKDDIIVVMMTQTQ